MQENKISFLPHNVIGLIRPLEYERVYLPLYKVADTPFHIQGDELVKYLK